MSSSATSATSAVKRFEKLFLRDQCAVDGCDRRPAPRSRFCGCHLDDRREGRVTVFHGSEPLSAIGERHAEAMQAQPMYGRNEANLSPDRLSLADRSACN